MKPSLRSIRFKLAIGGVLTVLLPLICIGWLSYSKANQAILELSMDQAHGTAKDLARATFNKLAAEINQVNVLVTHRKIGKTGYGYMVNQDGLIIAHPKPELLFEMNANMTSVASAMEQSASNTDMVATASGKMSTTIGEIAKNAENARDISDLTADRPY